MSRIVVGPVGHYNIRGANPGGNWISFLKLDDERTCQYLNGSIPSVWNEETGTAEFDTGFMIKVTEENGEAVGERTMPFAAHSPSGRGIRNYKFTVPEGYAPVLNNSVMLLPWQDGQERSESVKEWRNREKAVQEWIDAWSEG
jgi:hypothetical protein